MSALSIWCKKANEENSVIYQDNVFHRCYLIPSLQYPSPDQLQHQHTHTHYTYYLNVFVKTIFIQIIKTVASI